MPKLRFKESREEKDEDERRERKHHKKKKKRKRSGSNERREKKKKRSTEYYVPPTLYEVEEGWVPPDHDDEAEWRDRLFTAMAEDEGIDPFYTQYDESRSRLDAMDEESYRAHIAREMHRRKNADAIAAEEALKAEAKRKRKEQEKAQARLREEQKRQEAALQQLLIQDTRTRYEEKWEQLENTPLITSTKAIPWPMIDGSFSQESLRKFLVQPNEPLETKRKAIRRVQMRYHPDKFTHRVLRKFQGSEQDKTRLMNKINSLSGWLNDLWQEVNRTQ